MNFLTKWYSPQLKTNAIVSILGDEIIVESQEELIAIVAQFLWLSYRSGFCPISYSGYITDGGWGCMLRTGQMIVAQTLLKLFVGKNATEWKERDAGLYQQICNQVLSYFNDTPDALFSLHNIATIGENELKKPIGQWFGPSTISFVLKEIAERNSDFPLNIFLAPHSVIFQNEVIKSCKKNGEWKPLLLLIPTRLGVNKVNPVYLETLKIYMQLKQSVGILGGAPNASYYFYGIQGDTLFYLDPHTVQYFTFVSENSTREDISSYFSSSLLTMNLSKIDESLAFGFYCDSEKDFQDLIEKIVYLNAQESFNDLFSVEKEFTEATYSMHSFCMEDSFSSSSTFSPFKNSAISELSPVYISPNISSSQNSPLLEKKEYSYNNDDDDFEVMSFVLMGSTCSEDIEINTTIKNRTKVCTNEHSDDFDFEGNVFTDDSRRITSIKHCR